LIFFHKYLLKFRLSYSTSSDKNIYLFAKET